jgi:hypothetical protein
MRAIEKIVRSHLYFSVVVLFSFNLISCEKQMNRAEEVSQSVKDKIFALGFSTENIQRIDGGYLAEGDIILSESELGLKPQTKFLRIAGNEQYRTYNLLTALPRTVTIGISSKFSFVYAAALDEAIRRYNAENLQIHFQRANNNADINIARASGNWIASSGLPSATGTLYRTINLNPWVIGNGYNSGTFINYLATLIAHEIGHCIGLRHTDYMNRSFSCPGHSVNEGAGDSGAVNIPGTPVSSDNGSWMLACIKVNENRPFNENDKIALQYLY